MTRLPFGKFRGLSLSDPEVSAKYLAWVLEDAFNVTDDLKDAIMAELCRRFDYAPRLGKPGRNDKVLLGNVKDSVDRWFRRKAKQYHPDTGGSDQAMSLLNDIKDELTCILVGAGAA
jgi:hypothetical protein